MGACGVPQSRRVGGECAGAGAGARGATPVPRTPLVGRIRFPLLFSVLLDRWRVATMLEGTRSFCRVRGGRPREKVAGGRHPSWSFKDTHSWSKLWTRKCAPRLTNLEFPFGELGEFVGDRAGRSQGHRAISELPS